MDKKFVRTALAVVLGIAILITAMSAFSLLFDAILSKDLTFISSVSENMEKTIAYIRNTSIGVVCVAVAALACYCFTYFSEKKNMFACLSAGAGLALAAFCIAFVFDLRAIVLKMGGETPYAAATAYFSELLTLAAASLLLCAYFTVIAVRAFTAKKSVQSAPQSTEETSNEKN